MNDLPLQKRESVSEEAIASLTPLVNEALQKMDYSSVVCAYQVPMLVSRCHQLPFSICTTLDNMWEGFVMVLHVRVSGGRPLTGEEGFKNGRVFVCLLSGYGSMANRFQFNLVWTN